MLLKYFLAPLSHYPAPSVVINLFKENITFLNDISDPLETHVC